MLLLPTIDEAPPQEPGEGLRLSVCVDVCKVCALELNQDACMNECVSVIMWPPIMLVFCCCDYGAACRSAPAIRVTTLAIYVYIYKSHLASEGGTAEFLLCSAISATSAIRSKVSGFQSVQVSETLNASSLRFLNARKCLKSE